MTKLDDSRRERSHRWPWFLPGGKHFVYLVSALGSGSQGQQSAIFVSDLESNESHLLLHADSNMAYASGHLLYVRERTLLAHPFDASRRRLTKEAVPLAEQVQYDGSFRRAVFSASGNGVVVYQTGGAGGSTQLGMFDRTGRETSVLGQALSYSFPTISPDGQRVAVSIADPADGNIDLWIHEIARGVRMRLTSDVAVDIHATWSPDTSRLAFASFRKGRFDIYQNKLMGQVNLVRFGIEVLVDAGSFTVTSGILNINAVAPGWVRETLEAMKMDPSPGVPAAEVAQAYVRSIEGRMTGQILDAVAGAG